MGVQVQGSIMEVCVQGLWHLGSVTAACLASVGHDVIGLDTDPTTIDGLAQGKAPLFEPELDALIQAGIAAKNLRFLASPADAVAGAAEAEQEEGRGAGRAHGRCCGAAAAAGRRPDEGG